MTSPSSPLHTQTAPQVNTPPTPPPTITESRSLAMVSCMGVPPIVTNEKKNHEHLHYPMALLNLLHQLHNPEVLLNLLHQLHYPQVLLNLLLAFHEISRLWRIRRLLNILIRTKNHQNIIPLPHSNPSLTTPLGRKHSTPSNTEAAWSGRNISCSEKVRVTTSDADTTEAHDAAVQDFSHSQAGTRNEDDNIKNVRAMLRRNRLKLRIKR